MGAKGGYSAELEALEYGVNEVLGKAVGHQQEVERALMPAGELDAARMAGQGGQYFNEYCKGFSDMCQRAGNDLVDAQRTFVTSMEAFGNDLKQALSNYRNTENVSEESFRSTLRGLDEAPL